MIINNKESLLHQEKDKFHPNHQINNFILNLLIIQFHIHLNHINHNNLHIHLLLLPHQVILFFHLNNLIQFHLLQHNIINKILYLRNLFQHNQYNNNSSNRKELVQLLSFWVNLRIQNKFNQS